ncbi:MAG: SDR family NAD(P)-dependent oxidoreductase [Burkholderiales bacterium]
MNNAFDLKGRVAIVTGGNGGIGLGMARGLAQAGASVMIAGRNEQKNAEAQKNLWELGAEAASLVADVTQIEDCQRLIRSTVDRFGRLDILVNNAGMNIRKAPQDYSLEEWRLIMDTNLTSAFLCSQAAYPALKESGTGKVINIGSMTSIFGASFAMVYSASKGGIVQMTRAFATAWAKDNIQVNAVLPGWIDTDLTKRSRVEVEGLNERVLSRTPAGRWGVPEDFGGIAVFLSSPASDFVTGTAIPVDGGFSVQV